MRKLQKNDFDANSLLSVSLSEDIKNSSWRALHLGQPGLGLNKEYFDQVKSTFSTLLVLSVLYPQNSIPLYLPDIPTQPNPLIAPWCYIDLRSRFFAQGLQSTPVQAYMTYIKVGELLEMEKFLGVMRTTRRETR